MIGLRKALYRIYSGTRGDAKVIATFSVAFIAGVAGYSMLNTHEALAGALLGAAVSSVTGILAFLIGTSDSRSIPVAFVDAAKRDVIDTGYYKRDFEFRINIDPAQRTVRYEMESIIVPTGQTAHVPLPGVGPPVVKDGNDHTIECHVEGSKSYQIDGHDKVTRWDKHDPSSFSIDRPVHELLVVTWSFEDFPSYPNWLEDDHRSTCTVHDGKIQLTGLPVGWDFAPTSLLGKKSERVPVLRSGEARSDYRPPAPWFSQQGFAWKITFPEAG